MMEPTQFTHDVFLCHSSKDKTVVRSVAKRLKTSGLKVWFDEWELNPGDSIPTKIDEGLEHSRVLVLCMSANAFGSDWAHLESGTFRFRDPLNKERRFIPLRLDEAPIKESLAQFRHINWFSDDREREYAKLLEACWPPTRLMETKVQTDPELFAEKAVQLERQNGIYAYAFSSDGTIVLSGGDGQTNQLLSGSDSNSAGLWDMATGCCLVVFEGLSVRVDSVALSADQRFALTGSVDNTVRLWDVETGRCLRVFEGHIERIMSVALSTDERLALSGSFDKTIRLWDLETGCCVRVFEGHKDRVRSVTWSSDQRYALSGADDNTLRFWDIERGQCLRVLEGHTHWVLCVALSFDQSFALSGSCDNTLRLWDVKTGRCLRVFEGHTHNVQCIALSTDQRLALSASADKTVRLWDLATGCCLRVLKGHPSNIETVTWSVDQRRVYSGDIHGNVRVWDLSEFTNKAQAPEPLDSTQIRYTSAKVLLVGESGAGKTGLSNRLALNEWQPSDSTVGVWATQWKLPISSTDGIEREIWLWDFGGQADQRLIHQLYMDETALSVLVFDGQKEDLIETLSQWDRDLTRASRKEFSKLLVAGRVDAGGLRISRRQIDDFMTEAGYIGFLETSAKTGLGCDELRQAIIDGIRWEDIPWHSSPLLFKRLKDEIIALKDTGQVLIRFNELREMLQLRLPVELKRFTDAELKTVVSLLTGPGVVWELKFGSWVLLQPERINAYAQAVIQTMREDEYERGCLLEERVLRGDLKYYSSMGRLGAEEERFVLFAMHQTLVERGLCLREQTDQGVVLVFPSSFRRERPEIVPAPSVWISYRFKGFLDEIYAGLVVSLHHTRLFVQDQLWRNSADFRALSRKRLGVKLNRLAKGEGELDVYFDQTMESDNKILFSKYIHEYLLQHATEVLRLRRYVCPQCGTEVGNLDAAFKRLQAGRRDLICVFCESRIPLWDELEELSVSEEIKQRVRKLQDESATVLDKESKERALVGDVISTVTLAGQICREKILSNRGVDMEIEFKNDAGEATGKLVLLQTKLGDSYLRMQRNGTEIFTIRSDSDARYWMTQPFPVILLVGTLGGEILWMDVRDCLKRASRDSMGTVKEIVFQGERFDVMTVRRWRETMLHDTQEALSDRIISEPDEMERCDALKRLTHVSPDEKTRDILLGIVQDDPSAEVRATACEELCQRWWKEISVRRKLRTLLADESDSEYRMRLERIIENAKGQLSGLWETKLSGQHLDGKDPDALPGYPAFRVSRFQLRNIGPFKDTAEVELREDVNVFLGDNSSGKSTILRCLALAAVGLPAANEVEDNAEAYLRKGTRRGSIEVLFELIPDPDAFPYESGFFAIGLEITSGSSRFAPLSKMTLRRPGRSAERLPNSAEHLGALRSKWTSQFGFVSGYGAVRTFGESRFSIQPELKKRENEWVLSLFKSEAWLVNPEVFAKLIRGDTSNIEEGPIGGLSAGLINSLRISLGHLFPEVTTFFGEGDNDLQLNGTLLRFGELSDGYRSLLALMGHLLRCSLKVLNWKDNPTAIDGVTVIDEIDLHLHPAWQIHVVQDFRKAFPHIQLIVSTHSPLVVAALKRDHILIMRREEDGSIVIDRPEFDPQGLGVSGILTNIFSLSSTIDQPTLDKITRRLLLYSKREQWTKEEELEYTDLTEHLATLGFQREFTDPYFERFATAMARRNKVALSKLTPDEKRDLDEYADWLLANLKEGEGA